MRGRVEDTLVFGAQKGFNLVEHVKRVVLRVMRDEDVNGPFRQCLGGRGSSTAAAKYPLHPARLLELLKAYIAVTQRAGFQSARATTNLALAPNIGSRGSLIWAAVVP